jgi:hypothetical protein
MVPMLQCMAMPPQFRHQPGTSMDPIRAPVDSNCIILPEMADRAATGATAGIHL